MQMTGKDNKTNTSLLMEKGNVRPLRSFSHFNVCVCVWGGGGRGEGGLVTAGISFCMLISPSGLPLLCTVGGMCRGGSFSFF